MPLVENGQIVQDRYHYLGDDEPIPERAALIVPAGRFLANADALSRRDGSLGVAWPNDRRISPLLSRTRFDDDGVADSLGPKAHAQRGSL